MSNDNWLGLPKFDVPKKSSQAKKTDSTVYALPIIDGNPRYFEKIAEYLLRANISTLIETGYLNLDDLYEKSDLKEVLAAKKKCDEKKPYKGRFLYVGTVGNLNPRVCKNGSYRQVIYLFPYKHKIIVPENGSPYVFLTCFIRAVNMVDILDQDGDPVRDEEGTVQQRPAILQKIVDLKENYLQDGASFVSQDDVVVGIVTSKIEEQEYQGKKQYQCNLDDIWFFRAPKKQSE